MKPFSIFLLVLVSGSCFSEPHIKKAASSRAAATPSSVEQSLKACLVKDPKTAILDETEKRALRLIIMGVAVTDILEKNPQYLENRTKEAGLVPTHLGKGVDQLFAWKNQFLEALYQASSSKDNNKKGFEFQYDSSRNTTAVAPGAAALMLVSSSDGKKFTGSHVGVIGAAIGTTLYLSSGDAIDQSLVANTREFPLGNKKIMVESIERSVRPSIKDIGDTLGWPEEKQNLLSRVYAKEVMKKMYIKVKMPKDKLKEIVDKDPFYSREKDRVFDNELKSPTHFQPEVVLVPSKAAFNIDLIALAKSQGILTEAEESSLKTLGKIMEHIRVLRDREGRATESDVLTQLSPQQKGEKAIEQMVFLKNTLEQISSGISKHRFDHSYVDKAILQLKEDVDRSLSTIQTMCELAE